MPDDRVRFENVRHRELTNANTMTEYLMYFDIAGSEKVAGLIMSGYADLYTLEMQLYDDSRIVLAGPDLVEGTRAECIKALQRWLRAALLDDADFMREQLAGHGYAEHFTPTSTPTEGAT